jgi:hypothetical protein
LPHPGTEGARFEQMDTGDGPLREMENVFGTKPFDAVDYAALLTSPHMHRIKAGFVENLDRETEKYTAAGIKDACRNGWEKLLKQGVRPFPLKEKKTY